MLHILRIGLSLNIGEQVGAAPLERLVAKNVVHRAPVPLMEVVHVELAHEGVEIVVAKVSWKQKVLKLSFIEDFEANPIVTPQYVLLEILSRANLKNFHEEIRDVGALPTLTGVNYPWFRSQASIGLLHCGRSLILGAHFSLKQEC